VERYWKLGVGAGTILGVSSKPSCSTDAQLVLRSRWVGGLEANIILFKLTVLELTSQVVTVCRGNRSLLSFTTLLLMILFYLVQTPT